MSCSDLSNNVEIKTATNNILNNIYQYTNSDIYKPVLGNIFNDDFKAKYDSYNINTNLDNIDEADGKENLATIEDENVYINCVYQSSIPWYTTSEDKKKCEVISDISLPEDRLILDKKTLIVTPIFKSSKNDKPAFCSYKENVNKAYCENKWYDWIIIPNYYLGNTYYKDNSHYGENDVYKCYAPCNGDFMPYTKSNGELKCIPKKYFNSGIFSNKYIFSSFGLINLIGNIALSNNEKSVKQTNLLYILHRLIVEYNIENNYDKDLYDLYDSNAEDVLNKEIRNIDKFDKYNNIYNEFKDIIDKNILSKFSTSTNQDYSNTNEFTYKHRKFNEDETDMYSFNGLDVSNILIDPILIHTWMLANLFKPLDEGIINNAKIQLKITTDENKKKALDSLLYEKLFLIFNDSDKAIRLKNIFFKAVNICYNGKTNFSINIIEKTILAFTNDNLKKIIYDNIFYNFNENIFVLDYLITANSSSSDSSTIIYPFYTATIENTKLPIYKNYIDKILLQDTINKFKEYPLYKDVEISTFKDKLTSNAIIPIPAANDSLWIYKYFYSMERLEKPTCEIGYEWNETYKVCDLKKKEVKDVENKTEEDDFEIPELKDIFTLFVQMILFIIVLYIIYIFYDIFSEVIFSFFNAIYIGISYMYMKFSISIIKGETEYDTEEKKLTYEKKYIENKYKNIVNNQLKIDDYIETHNTSKI